MATLRGHAGPRESHICFVPSYFPRPGTIPSSYIRRGDWKLIRFHGDGREGTDRYELYDLADDVGESRDVSSENQALVERLNTELEDYLTRTGAVVPAPNPEYDSNAAATPRRRRRTRKPPNPITFLKRRDKNNDGFITLREYIGNPANRNVPALTRQFRARDADSDKRLTIEELRKGVTD
jgi:hypothetical protein